MFCKLQEDIRNIFAIKSPFWYAISPSEFFAAQIIAGCRERGVEASLFLVYYFGRILLASFIALLVNDCCTFAGLRLLINL